MDLTSLFQHTDWTTALVTAAVGVLSVAVTNWIAWSRFRRAYRLDDRTEGVLRRMLKDSRFKFRKFETVQHHVPLSEEKLREALLRAGAVQFKDKDGVELWGMLEDHLDKVFPKGSRN